MPRAAQRKAVATSHYLNAKLTPLHYFQLSIFNAFLKGLYTYNTPPCCKTIPNADGYKGTVSLNYSHLCHLTLKSTKKDSVFEFLCHSDKPPSVHVPPGLDTAV